jgi:hypothetical protein
MITYQSISSARAERHSNQAGRRIFETLLTATLAIVLGLASLTNLVAVEGLSQQITKRPRDVLALPRIQYLDSMPWMNWNASAPTLRIDTLILPGLPPWSDQQNTQVGTESSRTLT